MTNLDNNKQDQSERQMGQRSTHSRGRDLSTGALMYSHFNVRCPACAKLFRVDGKEIFSRTPHFDCTGCQTRFSFDFPPQHLHKVETKIVSQKVLSDSNTKLNKKNLVNSKLKKCPKCQTLNPQLMKECNKCGVLFEKLADLPEDRQVGAIPSLVRSWKELMSDYDNLKKHVAFVNRCEDLQALPFALKKYEALKEAQPHDEISQEMFHQTFLKNMKSKAAKTETGSQVILWFQKASAWPHWQRIQKMSPFAVALIFVIIGLANPGARNLVGIGSAIIFLTAGLRIFLKGRIQISDFW